MFYICTIIKTNKKLNIMTTATITKISNKIELQPKGYSLGFKRLTVLPIRVRKNINIACISKGENNDNSMKEYLNGLTKEEYINWLKIA